jgi:hypothetical protein
MTISPDVRKRVLYGKYLLFRAKSAQAEHNELSVAVSLLLMHDASELVMLAAADHLQLGAKWSFMEFWEKVKQTSRKEPGHKIPMDQLNTLRVGFKHKGTLPHSQTVRDLTPRVEAFCEEVSKDLLGLDFSELGLADLVSDDEVRKALQEAQQALKTGDRNKAFLDVRIAFDKLYKLISRDVALIEEPRSIDIPKGGLPSEVQRELAKLERGLEGFQAAIEDCAQTLNVLMFGIDPVKYRFFIANTPHVSWTVSGLHHAVLQRDYNNVPDEVFQKCFEFVVEVALNSSQ